MRIFNELIGIFNLVAVMGWQAFRTRKRFAFKAFPQFGARNGDEGSPTDNRFDTNNFGSAPHFGIIFFNAKLHAASKRIKMLNEYSIEPP